MKYKRPESVLVMVYDQKGQVLVMQRKDDPDFWQSVTGTIEENELPLETAIRELQEETGIDVLVSGFDMVDTRVTNQFEIRPQWRHKYPPGEFSNTEYVFSVCVDSQLPIVLTEHTQYCWIGAEEARQKVWSQSNKDAIARHFALSEEASSGNTAQ